ncbi:restriction endonuclease subunit S [Oscillatoria acuminata]|uniref:Restriction endonuclease S subunit n=1 Tax=Oscillatoria acuminata PCC 6304 TaxID=56110 RepID=K9TE77_9CYAN|nr:restriction endonuclease subunit S [Oscillatoria acuminata]AFY80820.1 restriction endonuclease S subunit [Oscillatoria acuminata PCC 6304]
MNVVQPKKKPLKNLATINDNSLTENTNPEWEVKYIDIGNVNSRGEINDIQTYRFADAPSRARRIVSDGDVIISTVRTYLQAIAPIKSPPDNLIVSTGFAVIRPRLDQLDADYCKYALREAEFLHEVVARSVGISYPAINTSDLGNIPIYIHSLSEQKAIAHYLDKETAKIDQLIEAKKRLLELLDEKRRALITHAVTRGLNPDVPMRDSGVEWIGEIPKHWSIQRLKTVSRSLQIGPFGSQLHAEDYVDDGIPVINPVHLVDGKIIPNYQVAVDQETAKRLSIYQLENGDVVFARRGEIGRCGVVTQEEVGWLCGSGSLRVRPNLESLDPEYLVLLVSHTSVGKSLSMMSVGTTMENLNTQIISDLRIPLPPLSEQSYLVSEIKDKVCQLNSLKTITEQTIKLLEERRIALISSTVTGQLKIKE